MQPLRHNEIRGNWATLLLSWNADESLDVPRVAAELDVLIASGVNGVYAYGTAGEFHAITECEFDTVAETLAHRCEAAATPFQIGASHMSAQISLERIRRSAALAPSAFQVILPDWLPPSNDECLSFLNRMSEAANGIGLVLYNPPHAKRVLSPAEIGRLARNAPNLIGVKTAGGGDAWYAVMREHMSGLSVFVPGHSLATGFANGAHGSYSNVACLNPRAAQAWWDQMNTDLPAALELEHRIQHFMNNHIIPFITEEGYSGAACDRLLARIGAWSDLSPNLRWPYRSIPAEDAERLRPIAKENLPEFFDF